MSEQPVADGQQEVGPRTEPVEPEEEPEQAPAVPAGTVLAVPESGISTQNRSYSNDLIDVTFSPRGGDVLSYRLLEHEDNGEPVEMVLGGTEEYSAFSLAFGGREAPPIEDLFHYRERTEQNIVEFYRDFYVSGNEDAPFRIVKRYIFQPGEYLFRLEVEMQNSVNEPIPLNFDDIAYTLSYGPQIGPTYQTLDNRNEYRRFHTLFDGRRRNVNLGADRSETVENQVDWAAIAGKYFAVIGIPGAVDYRISFATEPVPTVDDGAQMYFSRPLMRSSQNVDQFRFYVGPKTPPELTRYNEADENAFGARDLALEEIMDSRFLLGWLENVLKFLLQTFYRVIPNYGVAIILLTILVKVVLFPLTRKSYQSTAKMKDLGPKMTELKEKYKDDQQKLNQEMAALYKKEGVNPLGGCLPLLAQFPFFIAMFGLFNNHFDLRGATFIPGWISDLSAPEQVLSFGFTVPVLGWDALRLLPIIMVGTQILSSKFMQQPSAGGNTNQMKMMQYGLPIVFFFILYNMPSGLLVYWIVTNVLTTGQQMLARRRDTSKGTTK
jgi:YidC/Oxa1 family membrane protein insertase